MHVFLNVAFSTQNPSNICVVKYQGKMLCLRRMEVVLESSLNEYDCMKRLVSKKTKRRWEVDIYKELAVAFKCQKSCAHTRIAAGSR